MEAHQPWIRYCVQVGALKNGKQSKWMMTRTQRTNLDIVYFVARVVNLTAAPSLSSGLYTHWHKRQAAKVRGERREQKKI